MKLLDVQLVMAITPVYDLSYLFYMRGPKELFEKLEDYFIYYDSNS
jgi:hypothetical protein